MIFFFFPLLVGPDSADKNLPAPCLVGITQSSRIPKTRSVGLMVLTVGGQSLC